MTKDLEKLLKESGWMQPLPKSDPGHWQRVPKKDNRAQRDLSRYGTGMNLPDVDLAKALTKGFDLSDATEGLTINSDVATLNSKGMNVALDNPADVARMLTETMTIKTDAEKKDQSAARTSFENSMGDVKSALTNQQDTNQMLLSAIQELIRVQRSGVSVNEKILAAQA
jgi:hypothetical protein